MRGGIFSGRILARFVVFRMIFLKGRGQMKEMGFHGDAQMALLFFSLRIARNYKFFYWQLETQTQG